MIKLTIITINLNNASGLRKTIESVVYQNFNDFEYVVIDGGSTDGSMNVIKEFAEKITYWVSEPDKGIYNAMNKGILKATGKYLLFLNSGDWLVDEKVLGGVFDRVHDADILYGDIFLCYSDNNIKLWSLQKKTIDLQFLYSHSLAHPATFIKRHLFDNELYDEGLKVVSDWKFFLRKIVFENATLVYLNTTISFFKTDGISWSNKMQQEIFKERQIVLNSIFPKMVLSDIQELFEVTNNRHIKQTLELRKHPIMRFIIFIMLRFFFKFNKIFAIFKKGNNAASYQ